MPFFRYLAENPGQCVFAAVLLLALLVGPADRRAAESAMPVQHVEARF